MKKAKIYQIAEDWVIAYSKKEALQTYLSVTDLFDEDDKPRELSEFELNNLRYIKNLDDVADTISFQERLEEIIKNGEQIPDLFACSDY